MTKVTQGLCQRKELNLGLSQQGLTITTKALDVIQRKGFHS